MTGESGSVSKLPVDFVIRDLITTRRAATPEEIASIRTGIASAPVDERLRRVPAALRGHSYLGQRFGIRARSDLIHLAQRVVLDEQWAAGTTLQAYLGDLRRAVQQPSARLAVYHRRGGNIAALLALTGQVIAANRRGARSMPGLIVIYSVDRGLLLTGYQFSSEARLGIPGDAAWLT